jgi:hypothetical protein
MRNRTSIALSLLLLGAAAPALADPPPLDCGQKSLAAAVADARTQHPVITFTGVCTGPIVVATDGLTLQGVGTAIIDGGGQVALAIDGASRVTLSNFEVRNGLNGIALTNGAHVAMSGLNVHHNLVFGITIETGSSATVTGDLTSSSNGVFGINVNASSFTLSQATVTASGNALGIQIATNGNAFIGDHDSSINVTNNLATGLTVVSGAQLVSFGGSIIASGNPVAGVSVNSKAGLDLDAASLLETSNNGTGLLMQEGSVMTVFNTPQFSGQPGFSTINAHDNTGAGIRVLTASVLTLVNQARVVSHQNGGIGFVADNGSGVTLVNSSITGNTTDIQLTFGTRADLRTLTFGSYTCDATVLVRGGSGIVCPH